jgi:hypothetical protein
MADSGSMRRIWLGILASVALLSIYPAWIGRTGWWWTVASGLAFLVLAIEPALLLWQVRRRGEELQITDDGVLRRLARGDSEYVRWKELREVSIVMTQGVNLSDEFFFVLAGTGTSGVMVNQHLAARHDLLSHLDKLPGFDHRAIAAALASQVNQRYLLWRAPAIEGEARVVSNVLTLQ